MRLKEAFCVLLLFAGILSAAKIPAPLYVDTRNFGSADPEIVWNENKQQWWIFYNSRRVLKDNVNGGTPLGVAFSDDLINWKFLGYCKLDGKGGTKNAPYTCWAPAIIKDGDKYHMFVTYKEGTEGFWGSGKSGIKHYIAPADDLLNGWKSASVDWVLQDDGAIDAGLLKKDDKWIMYYRNMYKPESGKKRSGIFRAESEDLLNWEKKGLAGGDINNRKKKFLMHKDSLLPVGKGHPKAAEKRIGYQEAPYPFYWKGRYWLSTDPYLWSSKDCSNWKYAGSFMFAPSSKLFDDTKGRHASFIVSRGRCLAFYHTEPYRDYSISYQANPPENRIMFLQCTELKFSENQLSYERSALPEAPKEIEPEGEYWGQAAP
ncbi:glycoside hydrolase family protein [Sedimentisphaera salicampi]|uniref:family 43 glycosylhydrolase n=1 Tax=Sedimentisphaera salicampi TaxID=1941349 RepID=UPI000B9B0629|nr:family 43 glycosylhydrolase [Sedimentisphaera salicampi]OXU15527.1 Beta-xylosidase [Sedimentisphaera salicampi]